MQPDKPNWHLIPHHCREGLELYLEQGISTGSFLEAVLSNDLLRAFERADEVNSMALRNYVVFLDTYAPAGSWGSPAAYRAWIARGGLRGSMEDVEDAA